MIIYSNYDQKKQNKKSCCQKALDKIKDMLSSIKSFAKTKPIIFGLICFGIIAVIVVIIAVPVALSKNDDEDSGPCSKNAYSDECLYEKMISKQNEYPEGMRWTNENFYAWKGGIFSGGYGCAWFAFMLSDVCFGDIKAQQIQPCPNTYKVGDVVRINNDTHFVIILKIESSTSESIITIAEGNFNSAIHWGRKFTLQGMSGSCNYVLRRNPN